MTAQQIIDLINEFGNRGWRWAIDGPLPDPRMKWKVSIEKDHHFNMQWGATIEQAIIKIATTTANG